MLTLRVWNVLEPNQQSEVLLDQDVITIGRDASNVLVLPDHDRMVSRRHAALRCGNSLQITDLGSYNSTYLNDLRLQPKQHYEVRGGDVVRVGNFAIEVVPEREGAWSGTVSETAPIGSGLPKAPAAPPAVDTRLGSAPGGGGGEALPGMVSELLLLNELAVEIGASHDTNVIVRRIVQRSVQAVQAEQGDITLAEDKTQDTGQTMIRTMDSPGEAFHLTGLLLAWIRDTKQPLLLNDPHEHTLFGSAGWSKGVRSLLAVPLMVRSEVIGVLSVYNKKDRSGFTMADKRLLAVIAAQSAQVIENARLVEEERRYLLMQQELRVAFDIQTNLLPKATPALPGYDIAGKSVPAQVVGGDYFDFISTGEGRLAVCVGDVAGKGLPAALLMSNLQATLRAQTYWSSSVKQCVEGANNLLYQSTNRRTFVTLFYGVLDAAHHRFRYANAGHNRPLYMRNGQAPGELTSGGLALGIRPNSPYAEQELAMGPGDVLLIYSDGIPEACNQAREQFEMERLTSLLFQHRRDPSHVLVERVLEAALRHGRGAPQADDMTVLVVKREGAR